MNADTKANIYNAFLATIKEHGVEKLKECSLFVRVSDSLLQAESLDKAA